MKILVVGDVHFSQYSSIVRSRGDFYSSRLENCIRSVTWAEREAKESACDAIIYLGDFFDQPTLNAEEITAFREIVWSNKIQHIFLLGNHEMSGPDYNSAALLNLVPRSTVVCDSATVPGTFFSSNEDELFVFLPYRVPEILEAEWTKIEATIHQWRKDHSRANVYAFAHSDLRGIQMGQFISKEGLDINSIDKNCDLYFNGHIHNAADISEVIIDVGNLTGQNFSEDADIYDHHILLWDVGNSIKSLPNPFAFYFYKRETDLDQFNNDPDYREYILNSYKEHSILSLKCPESILPAVRDALKNNPCVEEFRIIMVPELTKRAEIRDDILEEQRDHIKQFVNYIKDNLPQSDYLVKELQEIQCI